MNRSRTARIGLATALLATLASACSSSSNGAAPTATTATAATIATTTTTRPAAPHIYGERYCELLLLTQLAPAVADVYNSFPMNDCPVAQWAKIDAKAIAQQEHVPLVVINGPRYWLMDGIQQLGSAAVSQNPKTFAGIAMVRRATVQIGSLVAASKPYTTHAVDRATVFTFAAGRTVYELTAADGSVYVMQSYSQQKDATLSETKLAGLAPRLALPAGWKFAARTLTAPLAVDTTKVAAQVLQDDLGDSYSFEGHG